MNAMNALMNNPAFQTYAVCSAILAIKMLLTGKYTSLQRMLTHRYATEEDAKAFRGQAGAEEHPAVAPALRSQRTDLENIPLFVGIGLLFGLDGASASAAASYGWTFTIARLLHWVVYLNHRQPWRAICYFVGYLCILGMAVQILL